MGTSQITFQEHIPKEREGAYYERPFAVPAGVCRIDVAYGYCRFQERGEAGGAETRRETAIVDLALRDGRGRHVGASGAGRRQIHVSGWDSSPGYALTDTEEGEWAVIVGAYRIPDEGVTVSYTVTFTHKERTLLLGDTHVHTDASDGRLPLAEAVRQAGYCGLDFLFITDHNGCAQNPRIPGLKTGGLTVLPGMEWTHYQGHAGLLGAARPIASPFCVNTREEVYARLAEARKNGAVTVLNHPFCPNTGWHFGLDQGGFDLVELVNGGVPDAANEECLRWWHERLCRGERLGAAGGSDYHRAGLGRGIGQPATALYALSPAPSDILTALRRGNGYIVLWPEGPVLRAQAGEAILGETAKREEEVSVELEGLRGGDVLRLITDQTREEAVCPPETWRLSLRRRFPQARFVRFELVRGNKRILLSNPIYFS